MKVAVFQVPFLSGGSMKALELIRRRISQCESAGVEFLCCPEAVLGGLADYAPDATAIAIRADNGQLENLLSPLISGTVTVIVGFTELADEGLYNSAAIFHRGRIAGIYRKINPAIRKSIYQPSSEVPVFEIGGLTFGIIICNDSNFPELATEMAAKGATAIFIPTNCGLPPGKGDTRAAARKCDFEIATRNRVSVIRADVVGRADGMISYGSSAITGSNGNVLQTAAYLKEDLIIADI